MLRSLSYALAACLTLSISAVSATPGKLKVASGVVKTPIAASSAATPAAAAPCTVTLFSNFQFDNFNAQYFTYTPACPGPWSKVLFTGSFAITPGIQFDRTAQIQLGYVPIYYGTTREDDPTFGPTWTVSRDLTDYSSLFTTTQSGEVDLGNLVNTEYTGVISGTASLSFYPVASGGAPPVAADVVYPLPDAPGGAVALDSGTSLLSQTLTLPTNIESAYLDVFAQSQNDDEFWWSCAPNDVATELEDCGNTAFRETEISIDGTPAGVAPVYPWIFTGGIDPNLWLPIPGVQTLNFIPYRVDLTPFAATLSNGQPHTVSLSVYNADNYFLVSAALLVYEDHGSTTVTGAITSNSIGSGPNPQVMENINVNSSGIPVGTILVTSQRQFTISGYVNTSHGKVVTTLNQFVDFSNNSVYADDSDTWVQTTSVISDKTVTSGGSTQSTIQRFTFPLQVGLGVGIVADGDEVETVAVDQAYETSQTTKTNGTPSGYSAMTQSFVGTDTIDLVTDYDLLQNSSLLSTNTNNQTCLQVLIEAHDDSVVSNSGGPCTDQ